MAAYRAWESARPDPLFRDALAARLAGEKGFDMTSLAPRQVKSGWPLSVRTKLIDQMLTSAVARGCECVVNLGAGFDARPYRLALPSALSWIEADFPELIDEKEQLLKDEVPRCSLTRERVDLGDAAKRTAFFDEIQRRYSNVLVLSEGVVVYLEDEAVRGLAADLRQRSAFRWWVVDFFSPAVLKMMRTGTAGSMSLAPLKFAPNDGVGFFEPLGWSLQELKSIFGEASRLRRAPWPVRLAQLLPEPNPRNLGNTRWAGVACFESSAA